MNATPDNTCFTIMPFSVREPDLPRYQNDKNHWSEVYHGLIVPAVAEAELSCERDDEDAASRLIAENIWRKIEKSDVILCDLSSHNPNVYLELGWALRADKRFVLIKDDVTQFNFDLNQFYTFEYSHLLQPSAVRQSISDLAGVIKATLADEDQRYSMVKKLALQMQSAQAVAEGNIEVRLLEELLSEVRSPSKAWEQTRSHSVPRFNFSEIKTQFELGRMLAGTTWRKRNGVEHVIFQDEGTFFNNLAGWPEWRRNSYSLGSDVGKMTLEWSVDGLRAPCRFNDQFNEFVEVANPVECRWSIVASEPYVPPWGK